MAVRWDIVAFICIVFAVARFTLDDWLPLLKRAMDDYLDDWLPLLKRAMDDYLDDDLDDDVNAQPPEPGPTPGRTPGTTPGTTPGPGRTHTPNFVIPQQATAVIAVRHKYNSGGTPSPTFDGVYIINDWSDDAWSESGFFLEISCREALPCLDGDDSVHSTGIVEKDLLFKVYCFTTKTVDQVINLLSTCSGISSSTMYGSDGGQDGVPSPDGGQDGVPSPDGGQDGVPSPDGDENCTCDNRSKEDCGECHLCMWENDLDGPYGKCYLKADREWCGKCDGDDNQTGVTFQTGGMVERAACTLDTYEDYKHRCPENPCYCKCDTQCIRGINTNPLSMF